MICFGLNYDLGRIYSMFVLLGFSVCGLWLLFVIGFGLLCLFGFSGYPFVFDCGLMVGFLGGCCFSCLRVIMFVGVVAW